MTRSRALALARPNSLTSALLGDPPRTCRILVNIRKRAKRKREPKGRARLAGVDSRIPHGAKGTREWDRRIHNGTREAMDLTNKVLTGEKSRIPLRISGVLAKWDEMIWIVKGIRTATTGTM